MVDDRTMAVFGHSATFAGVFYWQQVPCDMMGWLPKRRSPLLQLSAACMESPDSSTNGMQHDKIADGLRSSSLDQVAVP